MRRKDCESSDAGHGHRHADGFTGSDVSKPKLAILVETRNEENKMLTIVTRRTLIGSPVGGAILTRYDYLSLSMFTGGSLLIGSILVVVSRMTLDKRLLSSV